MVPKAEELFNYLNREWSRVQDHLTASFSRRRKIALSNELRHLIKEVEDAIAEAARARDEEEANGLRSAEILIRSVISELAMWLDLARDRGDAAWNHFCDAESRAFSCTRWLSSRNLGEQRLKHLEVVEGIAFPPQPFFFSVGFIAARRLCTVCNSDYGTCEHMAGDLYFGQIAGRRVTDVTRILELSFVNDPRNKRCRIMNVGGIDPLTGEESRYIIALSDANVSLTATEEHL